MDNETTTPETSIDETPSTPLSRKVLIMAGAVTGIILAGGFAFLKKNPELEAAQEAYDDVVLEEMDNDPTITE